MTLRYRQTLLGVVWVILQPLLTALIFAVVFGKVAKLPSGGVPYMVFAFAGLLAWNLFNGIISRAATSLVSNRDLVSKVFFPACWFHCRRRSRPSPTSSYRWCSWQSC